MRRPISVARIGRRADGLRRQTRRSVHVDIRPVVEPRQRKQGSGESRRRLHAGASPCCPSLPRASSSRAVKCRHQAELSLETLVWTRGRNMPLAGFPAARFRSRAANADKEACGVGIYPSALWWRFGDYVNLRPDIPLCNAGDAANPIAPNAYNYVISLQRRNPELKIDDLQGRLRGPRLSASSVLVGPLQSNVAYRTHMHWEAPGTCDPTSAKLLTPEVGEGFEALVRPLGGMP